jgi:hypothetical protein
MTNLFALTLFTAGLLATAASAQTATPAPGSENTSQPPGFHNNMMPVKPLPVRHHRRPTHKPASPTSNSVSPSSSSSSSSSPNASSTPPASTAKPEATTNPNQGKPGTQTRQQGNTTNMHTPGSENSQDQGPTGAPKA